MSFKALIQSKGLFVALATEVAKLAPVVKAVTGAVNLGAGGVIAAQVASAAQVMAVSGNSASIEQQVVAALVAAATSLITSGVHKLVYWMSDFADDGKLNGSAPVAVAK